MEMKKPIFGMAIVLAALTGCSTGCPAPNATALSVGPGAGAAPAPNVVPVAAMPKKELQVPQSNGLCLFTTHNANSYFAFSNVEVRAAVGQTVDGKCLENTTLRPVQKITLGWLYKGEAPKKKECAGAASCDFSERKYQIGLNITCFTADAFDPALSTPLHYSSNPEACP